MSKDKVVIVKTYRGSVYTITISEMTEEYIAGVDKFGIPIKVDMSNVKEILPCSGTGGRW